MRSQFVDKFNHDEDALGYDEDVRQEKNPVRKGYSSVLSWIGRQVAPGSTVLDLGSGTGNTILSLPTNCRVTAVDISSEMTELAMQKLKGRSVTYQIGDVLELVEKSPLDMFDVIVSSYALHHLTPDERRTLFTLIYSKTQGSVTVVIGDLMYKDEQDKTRILEKYQVSNPYVLDGFEEEFYWQVRESDDALSRIGWETNWQQFSDLSWGVRMGKR